MSAIQAVLAVTDFSEEARRAAQRAALLASEHSARLQVMHVMRADVLASLRAQMQLGSATEESLLASARSNLDALCSELTETLGSKPEALVRSGNLLDEILGAADHAQVLLLGAHGSRPIRASLLGTTAERLLRQSQRPMIVVRREPRAGYERVLVPIDFSMQSLGALTFAQELAPRAHLQVQHLYDCPYAGKLRQAGITEDVIEKACLQIRDQALANMANVFSKWVRNRENAASTVERGNPKLLIPRRAETEGADLVVLGKRGQSLLGEYLLGSVSRHALAELSCDVAIVPDWPRV